MFTTGWEARMMLELEAAFKKLSQEKELQSLFAENVSSKKFLITRKALIEVSNKYFFKNNHLLFSIEENVGNRIDEYFIQYGTDREHIGEIGILIKKYFPR